MTAGYPEKPIGCGPVQAVVLAAGRSSRMGGPNKLMALFSGVPLIRQTVVRALASKAAGVVVVTGHQSGRVAAALAGLEVQMVHNPDFPSGLAGSLKAGVLALPDNVAGALVVLADMPAVETEDMNRMINAFTQAEGQAVVRATHEGRRGNPVLLPGAMFAAVALMEGDTGARSLIDSWAMRVVDIEIGEAAILDVDTPEALGRAGGVLRG